MDKPKAGPRQHLSKEGVMRTVRVIQATPPLACLTWSDIQKIASEQAGGGYVWTRQALERHAEIKRAYQFHEERRKKLTRRGGKGVSRLTDDQKLSRLEQENEALRKTLSEYDARFATYLANAIGHGMSLQEISKPLSAPSRGKGNTD